MTSLHLLLSGCLRLMSRPRCGPWTSSSTRLTADPTKIISSVMCTRELRAVSFEWSVTNERLSAAAPAAERQQRPTGLGEHADVRGPRPP